jgi:soluble lytic murein transglycosylase-like protein
VATNLGNPLLNQSLTPAEVYKIRKSGTPIPGTARTKTDAIESYAGFNRKLFGALGSNEIAANLDRLQPYVALAAKESKISPDLINAILTQESKGVQNAISGTGALGASQLTYWIYGPSKALGDAINPFDPAVAISRQAEYLSQLSMHYSGDLDKTVAAYNQGQPPVDKAIKKFGSQWLSHIDPEGKNYVTQVNNILRGGREIPGYFGTRR